MDQQQDPINQIANKETQNKQRSDSPVFGVNDSNANSNNHPHSDPNELSQNSILNEQRGQLRALNNALNDQQEEYKEQLVKIETVSMMTKYQLVFVKMESALVKFVNILKKKDQYHLQSAFSAMFQKSNKNNQLKYFKSQFIYQKISAKISKFSETFTKLQLNQKQRIFKRIWMYSNLVQINNKLKEDKENYIQRFNSQLSLKDEELGSNKKKIDELNTMLIAGKSKENDILSKLKNRDAQLQNLENERAVTLKNRKGQTAEQNYNLKQLEEQIREIQLENDELREKLVSAENNVGSFIKEMSDMLDTHEISTNVGSDNNSFQHQEFEEDFDLLNRIKDNTRQQQQQQQPPNNNNINNSRTKISQQGNKKVTQKHY